jgi:type II secretion system (T2SS) protein M
MTLFRRILREKRLLIVPLALGIVLNIAAYVFWVRPLARESAGVTGRAANARLALLAAERDNHAARALVTGTSQADQELSTFYDEVLPADLSSARRLTFTALPALARKMNVKFLERRTDVDPPAKNARVGRLKIRTELQGDYEDLRQFIFQLESSPEFVIIDDVTLSQNDPAKPLALTIELSTYYRLDVHGN